MATGYSYHPDLLAHDTGTGHPERPARLSAAHNFVQTHAWYPELVQVPPTAASLAAIKRNHKASYIEHARAQIALGANYLDSRDVAVSAQSFEVALLAAGAGINLCDAVMAGRIENGYALIRPPGHHAENDQALGFCIFNNVAIAARHLRAEHGIGRVAILDWDVHHGNGTQHSFETDPDVLYISLHQFPFYPGTGAASEVGLGPGTGSILNCPLPAGSGAVQYELAFHQQIIPKLDEFRPEFILISCGFDAHENDPLGSMALSTEFFGNMTEWMLEVAHRHCAGRLVSLLEGGYDIDAMRTCSARHLDALRRA